MSKKLFVAVTIVAGVVIIIAGSVSAATFMGGENKSIPSSDVINDDLYISGGIVNIFGNINGDVYGAGGQVSTSGVIGADAVLAGGEVNVKGNINGDARIAGGTVNIDNVIKEDALLGGGQVTIGENGKILGQLNVGAGMLVINGVVNDGGRLSSDELFINGTVNGATTINAKRLVIASSAVINGTLEYNGPVEAEIAEGAQVTDAFTFNQTNKVGKESFVKDSIPLFGCVLFSIWFFSKLIWALVVGLVLILLFPKRTNIFGKNSVMNFWSNLGIGFLVAIVTPIVGIILAITVIGLPFAFILGILYLLWMIISWVLGGIVAGGIIMSLKNKTNNIDINWKNAILGIIILNVVEFVPFIGWTIGCAFFMVAFGTIARLSWKGLRMN